MNNIRFGKKMQMKKMVKPKNLFYNPLTSIGPHWSQELHENRKQSDPSSPTHDFAE